MSGPVAILVKLGVRLVVFTAVFYVAAKKNEKIVFAHRWAPPVVALVFAMLNTALYWALSPLLAIATLGAISLAMPFVVNAILLWGTVRIFASRKLTRSSRGRADESAGKDRKLFEVQGVLALMWMATFLTLAHGALWLALDYIPARV